MLTSVIIVHPREKPEKCTVRPLQKRDDFLFHNFPVERIFDPSEYVRLGIGGKQLGPEDNKKKLLFLDASWRHEEKMRPSFEYIPVRSIPPWKTAYPRVSRVFNDPSEGLATVEAIFAAFTILGRSTQGLLDDYFWKEDFLASNSDRLLTAVL